jgi:hypothetical protein
MKQYLYSLREKLASGESVVLTHDQAQRAASAMFTNQKRAEEASLLSMLTQGLQKSFQADPFFAGEVEGEKVAEIEPGEVVGEVLAEDEG